MTTKNTTIQGTNPVAFTFNVVPSCENAHIYIKTMQCSFIRIGLGFVIGLVTASLVFQVVKHNDETVKKEQSWFVCTRVNMSFISDAVASFVRTNATTEPVKLETLVRAGLLPEWSEIYICPGWFGIGPLRSNYDESFQSKLFAPSPIAAHYSKCSYYVETLPDGFRVRCQYHTNMLDYTIPRNASGALRKGE